MWPFMSKEIKEKRRENAAWAARSIEEISVKYGAERAAREEIRKKREEIKNRSPKVIELNAAIERRAELREMKEDTFAEEVVIGIKIYNLITETHNNGDAPCNFDCYVAYLLT